MAVPTGVGIKVLAVEAAGLPPSGRRIRNQLLWTEQNPPVSIPTCIMGARGVAARPGKGRYRSWQWRSEVDPGKDAGGGANIVLILICFSLSKPIF